MFASAEVLLARHGPGYCFSAVARCRVDETKESSLSDSRLILTFASAPSMAAHAKALAVVKSDFMFGFVIGPRPSATRSTSRDFSATLRGTAVACFRAESIKPSAAAESRAFLYAAITEL